MDSDIDDRFCQDPLTSLDGLGLDNGLHLIYIMSLWPQS